MKFIEDKYYLQLKTTKRGDATCVKLDRYAKSLFKNVLKQDTFDLKKIESEQTLFVDYIKGVSSTTAKGYGHILHLLSEMGCGEECIKQYKTLRDQINTKVDTAKASKPATPERLEKYMTREQLLECRKKALDEYEFMQDNENAVKLRLAYLFCWRPLRNQDYYSSVLSDKPLEVNHLNTTTGELVLFDGKTQTKKTGSRTLKVPKDVLEIIQRTNKKLVSVWLVPRPANTAKAMDTHFGSLMGEVFGKGVSCNVLRNLCVSHCWDEVHKTRNFGVAFELARDLSHSFDAFYSTYTSYSKVRHPELPVPDVQPSPEETRIAQLEAEVKRLRGVLAQQAQTAVAALE
jgi:hypothetical protein